MGLYGNLRKKATDAGRFISTTGKGVLRKIGDNAGAIKSFGSKVNEATGGAAGAAWEASKSMPGIGAVTTNIEKGLNLAEKGSKMGLRAIDIGERATKVKGVGDARGVYNDARSLYREGRG